MERQSKPEVDRVCDEGDLELGEDIYPRMTVVNVLKSISSKLITQKKSFPLIKRLLLPEMKVKYVEDIMVTRDT